VNAGAFGGAGANFGMLDLPRESEQAEIRQ